MLTVAVSVFSGRYVDCEVKYLISNPKTKRACIPVFRALPDFALFLNYDFCIVSKWQSTYLALLIARNHSLQISEISSDSFKEK